MVFKKKKSPVKDKKFDATRVMEYESLRDVVKFALNSFLDNPNKEISQRLKKVSYNSNGDIIYYRIEEGKYVPSNEVSLHESNRYFNNNDDKMIAIVYSALSSIILEDPERVSKLIDASKQVKERRDQDMNPIVEGDSIILNQVDKHYSQIVSSGKDEDDYVKPPNTKRSSYSQLPARTSNPSMPFVIDGKRYSGLAPVPASASVAPGMNTYSEMPQIKT